MVGILPPGPGHLPTVKVFSHFFPFGCSLVSEGGDRAETGSEGRQKMQIPGHIRAGQTLFLTFSVFKASLVIGGTNAKEFQPHFRRGRVKRAANRIITLRFTFRVTRRVTRSC